MCACYRLCDGEHPVELAEKLKQYKKANTENCLAADDTEMDTVYLHFYDICTNNLL